MQSSYEFSQEQEDAAKEMADLVGMSMAQLVLENLCIVQEERETYKKHLELRPSKLGPDAGLGVFALKNIGAGETVTAVAISHVFVCPAEPAFDGNAHLMGFPVSSVESNVTNTCVMQHMFDVSAASLRGVHPESNFARVFNRIQDLKLKLKFVGTNDAKVANAMPYLAGSFINDGMHTKENPDVELPVKDCSELHNCNVEWHVTNRGLIEFTAIVPIKAGTEVLTAYGRNYWDDVAVVMANDSSNTK